MRLRSGLPCVPSVRVAVESNQSPVGLEIGAQVCEVHVVVTAREQHVAQGSENAGLKAAEMVGEDQVEGRAVSGSCS